MRSKVRTRLIMGILVLNILMAGPGIGSAKAKAQRVNCDPHVGPCTTDLAGNRVSLDISPKPIKAMRDLTFTLSVEGKSPGSNPYIDLSMPGMNMGRNRVILKPIDESVFRGTGIIVR